MGTFNYNFKMISLGERYVKGLCPETFLIFSWCSRFPGRRPINYAQCISLYHYLHDIFILLKYLNFLRNSKLGLSKTKMAPVLFLVFSKVGETPSRPSHGFYKHLKTLKSHNNGLIDLNVYH